MRDRLIELIQSKSCDSIAYNVCMKKTSADCEEICRRIPIELEDCEKLADHLLANGVIIPPCKVGDTVYSYSGDFGVILPYFVENLTIAYLEKDKLCYTYEANCHNEDELLDSIDFDIDDIGKTVFFSREESEAKLKGGKG